MKPELIKRLEANGWTVECYSPFELHNEDGSFATGQAAEMVLWCIKDNWYDDGLDIEAERKYNREVEFDAAETNYEHEQHVRRCENDYDYERNK